MVELNFSFGDKVKFRLALDEIEGTVLENADETLILVKLNSGYNIGIPKDNILDFKIIKKYHEIETKKELPVKDTKKKNIGIILTGGTIASKVDYKTGAAKPIKNTSELLSLYPEIFKIANISRIESPFLIVSEQMTSEHWIILAQKVYDLLLDKSIDGIIITHGTDTLHYTSYALSFFLKNINKPIVLTYSQRSIDRASSDAHLNLECATKMAISDCAEIMIVGHGSTNDDFCLAIKGVNSRKMHTSRRDAFKSINSNPLAKIDKDSIQFLDHYNPRKETKVSIDPSFSDKVALLKVYPGQDPSILDFYALKYKGIVIEGTGFGHLPSGEKNDWLPKLKKHMKNGLVVCMTSQCIYGNVNEYVYSPARELSEAGVIYLENMLSETALVKLGWVLGHYGWKAHVKEKMLENVAGEINPKNHIQNI